MDNLLEYNLIWISFIFTLCSISCTVGSREYQRNRRILQNETPRNKIIEPSENMLKGSKQKAIDIFKSPEEGLKSEARIRNSKEKRSNRNEKSCRVKASSVRNTRDASRRQMEKSRRKRGSKEDDKLENTNRVRKTNKCSKEDVNKESQRNKVGSREHETSFYPEKTLQQSRRRKVGSKEDDNNCLSENPNKPQKSNFRWASKEDADFRSEKTILTANKPTSIAKNSIRSVRAPTRKKTSKECDNEQENDNRSSREKAEKNDHQITKRNELSLRPLPPRSDKSQVKRMRRSVAARLNRGARNTGKTSKSTSKEDIEPSTDNKEKEPKTKKYYDEFKTEKESRKKVIKKFMRPTPFVPHGSMEKVKDNLKDVNSNRAAKKKKKIRQIIAKHRSNSQEESSNDSENKNESRKSARSGKSGKHMPQEFGTVDPSIQSTLHTINSKERSTDGEDKGKQRSISKRKEKDKFEKSEKSSLKLKKKRSLNELDKTPNEESQNTCGQSEASMKPTKKTSQQNMEATSISTKKKRSKENSKEDEHPDRSVTIKGPKSRISDVNNEKRKSNSKSSLCATQPEKSHN